MQALHSDLWVTDCPLRFLGLEVGARMTIIRLPNGELLLHSPVAATPDLVRELKALGQVAYLIAPNLFHHLYVGEWQEIYPEASLYVAPGLERKRSDLDITGVLTDEPEPSWKGTVDQVLMKGFPLANEVVFFHRPSETLIATDLVFNVQSTSHPATRLVIRLIGKYGRLAPTLLERLFVRNRQAFRDSLNHILEWPFTRVVVSHGEVSEKDGRGELIRGYSWILGEGDD